MENQKPQMPTGQTEQQPPQKTIIHKLAFPLMHKTGEITELEYRRMVFKDMLDMANNKKDTDEVKNLSLVVNLCDTMTSDLLDEMDGMDIATIMNKITEPMVKAQDEVEAAGGDSIKTRQWVHQLRYPVFAHGKLFKELKMRRPQGKELRDMAGNKKMDAAQKMFDLLPKLCLETFSPDDFMLLDAEDAMLMFGVVSNFLNPQ